MKTQRIQVAIALTFASVILLCPQAGQAEGKSHWEVVIETDGTSFKAISKRLVPTEAPKIYRKHMQEGFLSVESIDASGKSVEVQSVPDPRQIYYDYIDEVSQGSNVPGTLKGGLITLPKAQMVISLPDEPGVILRELRISRQKALPKGKKQIPQRFETQDARIDPESEAMELVPEGSCDLGEVQEERE